MISKKTINGEKIETARFYFIQELANVSLTLGQRAELVRRFDEIYDLALELNEI